MTSFKIDHDDERVNIDINGKAWVTIVTTKEEVIVDIFSSVEGSECLGTAQVTWDEIYNAEGST